MDAPIPRLTVDDLNQLDPTKRWELIDGVPYAMSGASLLHQSLLGELFMALKQHFRGGPCRVLLAPFDVKFSQWDVVQPDLLVACGSGLRSSHHEGPPDLVVEIASPSTYRHDRMRKLDLYSRMGVPEYWLVTPAPLMVEVLRWRDGSYEHWNGFAPGAAVRSARFPELRLDLAEIAAALPPQPPLDEVRENPPVYATYPEN